VSQYITITVGATSIQNMLRSFWYKKQHCNISFMQYRSYVWPRNLSAQSV